MVGNLKGYHGFDHLHGWVSEWGKPGPPRYLIKWYIMGMVLFGREFFSAIKL